MNEITNKTDSDKFKENTLDIGFMLTNINTCPVTIIQRTPVIKIHYLFIKLGVDTVYVC